MDCVIFYTNLHELFCQFKSWTNWISSGKFRENCWIVKCQVMVDMKKVAGFVGGLFSRWWMYLFLCRRRNNHLNNDFKSIHQSLHLIETPWILSKQVIKTQQMVLFSISLIKTPWILSKHGIKTSKMILKSLALIWW